MKHFYLRTVILCLLATMGAKASAHDIEVMNDDGVTIYYKWINNKTELAVTYRGTYSSSYDEYTGKVVIPEFVVYNGKTYSVTDIGPSAFSGCSGLTSVIIPNSVTSIGDNAFYRCKLRSVTIGDSVTSIGDYAFQGCTGLTYVTIPNSVTSIGDYAFSGCPISSVIICDLAAWCNISFPEYGNPLAGASLFIKDIYGEWQIITELVIPSSVTSIGNYAFKGCKGLTSVTIPNSVTTIGNYAFQGCNGITSVTIGDSVGTIGKYAFQNCNSLTSVTIPNSVTIIDDYAFENCTGLTSLTIGDSVGIIGKYAFENCTGLTSLTIPNSVTSIGGFAFSGCTGLTSVIFGNGVTSIGGDAFSGCTGLTSVIFGNGVTHIGWFAFYGCSGLTSLTIPDNVRAIGSVAFPDIPIYVNEKTTALLALWKEGYKAYKIGTYERLVCPSLTFNVSPTTYTCQLKDKMEGYTYKMLKAGIEHKECFTETGLEPASKEEVSLTISLGEVSCSQNYAVTTQELTLSTLQPKVISAGNVIVAAESNLDDAETNVGFEWRRTDWTDDFASNTGGAVLYEGTMEGYIRNLYTEKLWKYRPYYESNSGQRYYGEWVGIDPTNTSYFEPTVHTYAQVSVVDNTALVKGYAMRGTDNVAEQGFKYWKLSALARGAVNSTDIPVDAMTVKASGQVMTAQLTDLDYETDYCYVAFVTTNEGETFYGEQQSFKTGVNTSGVHDATIKADVTEVARYDLRGRRIDSPQKGMNIVLMSDGSTRKVYVK